MLSTTDERFNLESYLQGRIDAIKQLRNLENVLESAFPKWRKLLFKLQDEIFLLKSQKIKDFNFDVIKDLEKEIQVLVKFEINTTNRSNAN